MGKSKHIEKIRRLFDKSPVVDFKSIERVLKIKKKKGNYAKLLIFNLIRKNDIKKIAKGFYTKHDDPALAVFSFRPAYLGLQCALSFHNLWEQETIPIIITTRKIRTGIRKVLGTNVLVRRIKRDYMFGFDYLEDKGFYFPYSDIEKTFIDIVVFNEKMSESVLKNIKSKINKRRLIRYSMAYHKKIQSKIMRAYL